jgi:hypothetical protein
MRVMVVEWSPRDEGDPMATLELTKSRLPILSFPSSGQHPTSTATTHPDIFTPRARLQSSAVAGLTYIRQPVQRH